MRFGRSLPLMILFILSVQNMRVQRSSGRKHRIRGVKWWNLALTKHIISDDLLNPETPLYINPGLQPLTRKQRRLVKRNPGTIVAIAKGARAAVVECQFQFRNRRWNCPVSDGSHGGSVFGKILRSGYRETAFIYAITSASLVHNIARACSEGAVHTCSCGRQIQRRQLGSRDWEWGGCSDNAEFGQEFARDFIDVVERGRDLRGMMNLHNNKAGRTLVSKGSLVKSNLKQECKCHGMSGSCTVKTCWMRLPNFRQVSSLLKDKFDGASEVLQGNAGSSRDRSKPNLIPVDRNHKPPNQDDLVYFEKSPDFCETDKSIGYNGTVGRECNATSIGLDGCDLMCCGRGYRPETYTARERCNCVFHWCCRVTCHTCFRIKVRHICL